MEKVEKKQTVKEIAKTEIIEMMKTNSDFSVKQIHTRLDDSGIQTSLDTVRKAVSELMEEKAIIKFEIETEKGFFFKTVPIKKKRGWKSILIRRLFKLKSGKITRTTLAKMIQSDERNTHILVSCILKNTDFGGKIIAWDKKEKSYVY